MKTIILVTGQKVLIDDIDFEYLNQFDWYYFKKDDCAISPDIFGSAWRMHRLIAQRMGFNMHLEVDHKNQNTMDNQRGNLRQATRSQNAANRGLQSNNTSGYKGVTYSAHLGKWRARIKVNQQEIYLGLYATANDAAKAYNVAAIRWFKEFAVLNGVK